ncbi:ABC transporter substrate-binding protein [Paenibacillaceae bacterium WGS1546]|uniref:ABC transporter substrate-binding protein n=1 Tax=Cohnella sp. WGS1546 TaxID=3366810 RepID=UPI00372D24ED
MVERKKKILLAMLAAITVLVTACGSGSDKNGGPGAAEGKNDKPEAVNLTFFTSQTKYKDVYKKIADRIKEKENITVDFQLVPDDQYQTMIKTKLATGDVPDIFEHNAPTEYATVNAEKNMLDLSDEPWVQRLVNPDILKDSNGKIWAMPRESSSGFMGVYYNKQVFEDLGMADVEAPKTYADFLAILDKIKNSGKDIAPIYMPDKDSWVLQIFVSGGLPLYLEEEDPQAWEKLKTNQAKWTDYQSYETVLNLALDLYKNGYVNKDHASATYDMAQDALATGKAAMMVTGEWTVNDMQTKYPDLELGSFAIPFNDLDKIAIGAFVQSFYIPKEAKHADAAKKFLELLSQPEYFDEYFQENPGFPAFKDINGGDVPESVKRFVDNYVANNNYTIEMNGQIPEMQPILSDLWKSYIDMVNGGATPKQVVENWQKKYEEFMKAKGYPGF